MGELADLRPESYLGIRENSFTQFYSLIVHHIERKMVDKMSYDDNKLALSVAKGQLTKGLNKLDESCKEMASMPDGLVNKMSGFFILNYSQK